MENIQGKLMLVGAKDDALWDTAKYIHRMKQRLAERPHSCQLEAVIYEHGTHFAFPEGLIKAILPVGSGLMIRLAFAAAKKYPKECRRARQDIERRIEESIAEFKNS